MDHFVEWKNSLIYDHRVNCEPIQGRLEEGNVGLYIRDLHGCRIKIFVRYGGIACRMCLRI